MTIFVRRLVFATGALLAALSATDVPADPVIATHPRLLFDAAGKVRLLAKKNASDPSWLALKARADTLATYTIYPYKSALSGGSPPGTIFYTYQGEGWLSAAFPLAFAYQMTGDTKYSSKLIELAQEMIRAQSDPDNIQPTGIPPLQRDNYYPARNLPSTLGLIYDYCYDQLSAPLKVQMITLMNQYFDDVRVNGYQAQVYSNAADGNFFGGHLYGVALMGYASFGDNARAQEMIEWARIRFDGTPGAVPASSVPLAWRTQVFDGGLRPPVALDFNGPAISGNPFKGGFDFQGWSYGSEEFSRMVDYMLVVKSATGEDLFTPHASWFPQILRGEKQALFPNRFMIDPTGDWGGSQGAIISRGLPTRLAFVLAGSPDGPGAQHFVQTEIAASTIPDTQVYPPEEWAEFFFADASRPSTELLLPPYYTGFAPNYPQGASSPGGTNGAIPYFIMRSDWGASATWASLKMGNQVWDDHQHWGAGHLVVARGSDYLLVSATDWKTTTDLIGNPIHGGPGILGNSLQFDESSLANTLYFDDFGEFQSTDVTASGGQSYQGVDQVVADELNQDFSYVRSDLSTSYNRFADPADTPNRQLDFFYRNFLYLRAPNVFVVYDQVQAKLSSNPRGAYRKHIRWHVPEVPVITGRTAQMDHGQSRLFLDALLPVNATLTVVDELTNPDPCDGSEAVCVPFGQANAGTLRIEVRDPLNPLFVPFLAVLQPGSNTSTAPTNTQVTSIDGKMIGVEITQAGGARSIVLFNNQPGQVPPPITSTSYNVTGPGAVSHTLLGVVPGALYSAVLSSGVMNVNQSPTGDRTSSPAGVLHISAAAGVIFADLSVTKSDGVGTVTPGQVLTYTITVGNAGPQNAPGVVVSDPLPGTITGATWTCAGAGGGTCSPSGSGNINQTVNLPVGGSVTFSLTGTISAAATGSLSNTATVTAPGGITDPTPGNNSATDTDTLTPPADLGITKTDGQTTAVPGTPVTYTIVVSNAGPNAATGATVVDAVPAEITGATWTCVGAGGGACTAAGNGSINDTVNLPAGGTVTYTLTGTISASAREGLGNTATVSTPGGTTDPNLANNSATDTDILPGVDYFTLAPCRVVDTRGGAPIGGPVLQGEETRAFAMAGQCGIPVTARAISINLAVTGPTAPGNVRLFPAGQPVPLVSSINYVAGQTRSNNAVIKLNPSGAMATFIGQALGTTVHLIIDVNGYFQ